MPNSIIAKPIIGGIIGVTVPIAIEYAAKGARLGSTTEDPLKGYKVSGVVGVGLGTVEVVAAWAGHKGSIGWPKSDEDVALMGAMGGAKLATGLSILILDELRKKNLYAFRKKRGAKLPIGPENLEGLEGIDGLERVTYPVNELVEEI